MWSGPGQKLFYRQHTDRCRDLCPGETVGSLHQLQALSKQYPLFSSLLALVLGHCAWCLAVPVLISACRICVSCLGPDHADAALEDCGLHQSVQLHDHGGTHASTAVFACVHLQT